MEATTFSKIIETSIIALVLFLIYCGVMKGAKKSIARREAEQAEMAKMKSAQSEKLRRMMDESIAEARAAKAAKANDEENTNENDKH